MSPRYFGTDGIRGVFGEPPLDLPFLRRLGYALARQLSARRPGQKLQVLLGRDTRVSGPAIREAVAEGLMASGHAVLDLGIVPTPAVPTTVIERDADLGIMITASHNPPGDNGIKLFDARGLKLNPAAECEIESWLERASPPAAAPPAVPLPVLDVLDHYCRVRAALLPPRALAGWSIALDPGHGATCASTPATFRLLGATLHTRATEPDGAHINTGAGSEHPEHLAALVRQTHARAGFAHDGDGDRLVACDETGAVVDGDQVLGILALHAHRQNRLKHNVLVTTIQSNLGLDQTLSAAGVAVVRVPVGDRHVLHKLLELGASLGGENSGHFIFPDVTPCGDGLLAALLLVQVMRDTGRPLSALRQEIPLLPQLTANLLVREKKAFEDLPVFSAALATAEQTLATRGRVLARYSGTEKKLRLLVEGPDRGELESLLATLRRAATRELAAEKSGPG